MKTYLATICLGVCTLALAQAPPPWGDPFSLEKSAAYQCLRAQQPIVIDGRLDDPAWAQAQEIEHFIVPPSMDWIGFKVKSRAGRGRRAMPG